MTLSITDIPQRTRTLRAKLLIGVLLVVSSVFAALAGFIYFLTAAPASFTSNSTFSVGPGSSVRAIARQAQADGFVKSSLALYLVLSSRYQPSDLFAGDYFFTEPVNTFTFGATLAGKQVQQNLKRLTFPEGTRVRQMATIAAAVLPNFVVSDYEQRASGLEGRLFPETYFVPDTFTASELVDLQLATFDEKIALLAADIESSGLSLNDVLVLASIVEREANDEESMRMVAGIYLNRLALGMPLQADASIEYVLDKPLEALTPDDLKIDSPYNTYINLGLPPTPIGNPGLQAITAVIHPQESEYYYYITAPDGTFYYAKTLNQHNANIDRYLR